MALTYLLMHHSEIKALFSTIPNLKETFKSVDDGPPFPSKPPIIVQRGGRATSIIGHAYDYLLRAYVQRLNSVHQESSGDHLAASIAVKILDSKQLYEAFTGIVARRNEYIVGMSPLTPTVIEDSIVLGQLEQFYRSGNGEIQSILHAQRDDSADLEALLQATERYSEHFKGTGILCNPCFGEAVTALVDGADGDLIIDDTLIDIKTESDFRWKIGQSRQLIAYWILSCLTPGFAPEIKRLAIWSPRYCRLVSITVEDICRSINMIEFVNQFVSIITSDKFEANPHLTTEQRRHYVQEIQNIWATSAERIKQYYQ